MIHYYTKALLISLIFLSLACQNKEKKPDHILERSRMAGILTSLMIHQNKVYHQGVPSDSIQYLFHAYNKKKVLKEHECSQEQFEKSYDYYVEKVARFDKLWTEVVDSKSLRKERQKL